MMEPSILIPVVLLAAGALVNFWSGKVPNWLVLPMLAAFPVYALLAGMPWMEMGWHALSFIITFAIVVALFAFGLMGGGAGKLVSATALWLAPSTVLWFLLLAVGLGVAILVAGQFMAADRAKVVASRFAGVVAAVGAVFLVIPAG